MAKKVLKDKGQGKNGNSFHETNDWFTMPEQFLFKKEDYVGEKYPQNDAGQGEIYDLCQTISLSI